MSRCSSIFRQIDIALVPARAMKASVIDATALRLRRKRHLYDHRPIAGSGRCSDRGVFFKSKPPRSVERNPIAAPELRSRVGMVLHGQSAEMTYRKSSLKHTPITSKHY